METKTFKIDVLDLGYIVESSCKTRAFETRSGIEQYILDSLKVAMQKIGNCTTKNMVISISVEINVNQEIDLKLN